MNYLQFCQKEKHLCQNLLRYLDCKHFSYILHLKWSNTNKTWVDMTSAFALAVLAQWSPPPTKNIVNRKSERVRRNQQQLGFYVTDSPSFWIKLSKTVNVWHFGTRFMSFVSTRLLQKWEAQWNKSRPALARQRQFRKCHSATQTHARALPKYVPDRKTTPRFIIFEQERLRKCLHCSQSSAGRRLRQRNLEENYFSK